MLGLLYLLVPMLHALLATIQGVPQQERYNPQHVLEVKWSQGCMGGMAVTWMRCLPCVTVYVLHVHQERMGQLEPPAPRALVGLTVRPQASQPALPAVRATMLEQARHYAVLAALARTRPRERHYAVLAVLEHIQLQQGLPHQDPAALAVQENFLLPLEHLHQGHVALAV